MKKQLHELKLKILKISEMPRSKREDLANDIFVIEQLVNESQPVTYQKCPKCDGQGTISKPPYVAGDVFEWISSSASFVCDVCNGKKIINSHESI